MRTITSNVIRFAVILAWLGCLAHLPAHAADAGNPPSSPPAKDPLDYLGLTATTGAAAGYLPDKACGTCHNSIFESYQAVGMAKSFSRPKASVFIENFDAPPFYHAPSQTYYEMKRVGEDGLLFRQYQLDGDGKPINVLEQKVDWILGSGHRTRSYLYQTPEGELYQLPIGWYSQTGEWEMSPGFDRPHHLGVRRRVLKECMFCHNGFPEVPAGSDTHWMPSIYPKNLPEGTGCQRCHGPGANHVRTVLSGGTQEAIRGAIVNPAKLTPERRDEVCFQCHLLPAISLIGVRRFDRPIYSYRPGTPLFDYEVPVDVVDATRPVEDRFEINHHGHRLRLSACYRESKGALGCITCHDPHRAVTDPVNQKRFETVCLNCHQPHAADDKAVTPADLKGKRCVDCHMPKRRTEDAIHVVMTDHKIQRRAAPEAERLAPLEEHEPVIEDVFFIEPDKSPQGIEGEIYRAVTVLRALPYREAIESLKRSLANTPDAPLMPYYDLAKSQLDTRAYDDAEKTLQRILDDKPDDEAGLMWMAVVRMGQRRTGEAVPLLRRVLERRPANSDAHYNLALILFSQNDLDGTEQHLTRTVELQPNQSRAWYYLGRLYDNRNQPKQAVSAYQRALAIEPDNSRYYLALVQTLLAAGNRNEAIRYLTHGKHIVAHPEAIETALSELNQADQAPASPDAAGKQQAAP